MRLRTFGGLWIDDLAADADAPRPRALALLALLAASGERGLSRDRVMAVLWPDSDEERARHALSQTLYGLRRVLGADVVLSTPELRLDSSRIQSDLEAFRAAVREKRLNDAAALYAGPFLGGFYLGDAPEFERWAETERASLATDGIRAIESIAVESARNGAADAADHWRRLTLLDPYTGRFAAAYMEALAARGDRAAALAHGKAHVELLRREFSAQPDAVVERVMAHLRGRAAAGGAVPAIASASPKTDNASEPGAATVSGFARPSTRMALIATAIVAAVALTGFVAWRSARAPSTPIVAVGRIRDLVAPESASVSAVLSEMLSTSLGRIRDLQVVANSRMLELTPRGSDTSGSVVADAARRAGATEVIEGELLPMPNRQLRLEIRRVDLRRGVVRGGYRVAGDDRIALFDSVTNLIAGDLRFGAPSGSLAEVSTTSPIAYRLYEEGLRAFYQYDRGAAARLFNAAIREDSTFAMAAYYGFRAAVGTDGPEGARLAELALRLSPRATLRDRLLIVTHVGSALGDPKAVAPAETLAQRFPDDPEALMRSAEVTVDLGRAVRLLNRSIALDSAAGSARDALCRQCDAFQLLALHYRMADSIDAAERALQRWIALRPKDVGPWAGLSDLYLGVGRTADYGAALRRYDALGGSRAFVDRDRLIASIQSDHLDQSFQLCLQLLRDPDPEKAVEYRWYCMIALRSAGRYRDARALLEDGRLPGAAVVRRIRVPDLFNRAILDMETGRPLAAVSVFRNAYGVNGDSMRIAPGIRARQTAWVLALSATAAVAGGDTAHARRLIDSIQAVSLKSGYPRDRALHHFIRGLLLARDGGLERAEAEYRAAITSPTYGYTRINYELGNTLLTLGRPAEGIGIVRAALHGGIEGSNLYVTRTELHELLARLFDGARMRDSATAHYRIVERSWRSADPRFKARYQAAYARLAP